MKNYYNHLFILVLFAFIAILFSCGHDHADGAEHEGHDHGSEEVHDHEGEANHEEDLHLTREQMETINLQFGNFSQKKINDYISATGTLGLPPNAYASVNAKAAGFIKGSNTFVEGSYIKQGTIMGYIESPDFITKQQNYLETKAEINYLRLDLARQQALLDAHAGIEKNVQKIQGELMVKDVQLNGTAKYLRYLGISTDQLSSNNIRQRIAIVAPMSGYLTSIEMHNGMYVEPSMELMEIVNEAHLHLELDVFEQDISNIKEGQKISYVVPALGSTSYDGEVHVIGKEFNTQNKTVRIHGHLEEARPMFIKDLFIEAKIWLNDVTVDALPSDAIIKDGGSSYIYVAQNDMHADEIEFQRIMVVTGSKSNGFTTVQLLNPIPDGMEIVVNGAYYVYAQSKIGGLEHVH